MNKFVISSFIILVLLACGGSSSDEPGPGPNPPPEDNNAPSTPMLVAPSDGLECTDNPLDFSWSNSTDPDGDALSYYIQVSTNNSFSEDLQVLSTSNTEANFTLKKGVAYYWRVNAKDSKNKSSSYSNVWKLYSEGDGVSNHLPYAPALISPALDASIDAATITLEWNSSDSDGDPLKFDIYFGTSNSPPLIIENSDAMTHNVDLTTNTTYYWKIVAKDDAGGETIGQIWSFNTK